MDPISKEQPESVKRHDAPATPEPEAVTALRQAYRRYWTTPREAKGEIWLDTYADLYKKIDAVGREEDQRILQEEAERFHDETGRCPSCLQAGPYHRFHGPSVCDEYSEPDSLLEGDERDDSMEIAGILQYDYGYSYHEAGRKAYEAVLRKRKGSRRRRSEKWTTDYEEGWQE